VIKKAVETERQNYMNVVEETSYAQSGPHANVLSTHSFLKFKFEDGNYRLKCRLFPHGNRDEERDALRKDSSTAQSSVIRLVLVIAMLHKFLWVQSMSSPPIYNMVLVLGEFLYLHLEDGLNQAACGDFCALHTV
jgi:hypothetical protein